MDDKKIIVASGYFDPLHIGHVEYLERAKKLGGKLIVIVNNDKQTVLKKGYEFMPFKERLTIVKSLSCVDEVFPSVDKELPVIESIRKLTDEKGELHIFAKGGDRFDYEIPEGQICKELGIEKFIIWGGNYFTDFLPPSMCWVIWNKEINGNFADVEMAWTSFHRSAKLYKWQWNGMIRKGEHKLEGKTRLAPTQKPVGLFIEIFNDFVFKTCYDPFLGSGTTMVACEQLNRICYGMEISPEYCAVIVRRMKALVPAIEIRCLNRDFDIEGEIQKALDLK